MTSGLEPAANPDGQAFPRELVDHVEHAELPAIVDAILEKIIGPDVAAMLVPWPNAGFVVEPEPPAFGLLWCATTCIL
jgi:hypothetical protein